MGIDLSRVVIMKSEYAQLDISPLTEDEREEFIRLLKKCNLYIGEIGERVSVPYIST